MNVKNMICLSIVLLAGSKNVFVFAEDKDIGSHQETDPCVIGDYRELLQPDRAAGFETTDTAKCDKKDFMVDEAWYRFMGEAGKKMATHCVPEKHCGTNSPGWLNGSHPTVEEGVVNRTVCFNWDRECCHWRSEIKVRNCGRYMLYFLKRNPWGGCSYRYCGNGPAPDPCDSRYYVVLNDTDRAAGFVTNGTAKCDRKSDDKVAYNKWYRFQEPAGDSIATRCVDAKRCGAEAPGWMQGHHPRAADGVVTRTVCYHWKNKCCYFHNEIKVKKCRGFYVYKFARPPASNLRYCGNGTESIKPVPKKSCTQIEEETNPCYSANHIKLSKADRAAGIERTEEAKCDQMILPKNETWYRFTGAAGTRMANKCVPKKHCGTNAPGWMNGSLPTEKEGEVNRTVCFHWKDDCCYWKSDIKVRNCGDFYVYYLKRDPWGGCSYRYCGNGKGPIPTGSPTPEETTKESKGPTSHPVTGIPSHPDIILTCGQDEMWISVPKYLLYGLDREHLRLNDVSCGATETDTHFVLHTGVRECDTKMRDTKNFIEYTNAVKEIPVQPNQIITRVRQVWIPFYCCYSNWGVVSSIGLYVQSRKVIFSQKGYGKFELDLNVYPDESYVAPYKEEQFPVHIKLRQLLYVELSVDTEDDRLTILAEDCFATPYSDPDKEGPKYYLIKDGCSVDETVKFFDSSDTTVQKFQLEAFKFLGDYHFVYFHCKVKICNASDPYSRCAQGCIEHRRRRSLDAKESADEEYFLAKGPFVRSDKGKEQQEILVQMETGIRADDLRDEENNPLIVASAVTSAVFLMGLSLVAWNRNKRGFYRAYQPLPTKID